MSGKGSQGTERFDGVCGHDLTLANAGPISKDIDARECVSSLAG
jgi:hypothetical protein